LEQKTELLPVKQKKLKPQTQRFYALLLLDGDKLLMTRNHPGSLLKNLWGIPLIEKEESIALPDKEIQKQILNHTGVTALSFQPLGTVRHVFTHRVWEMEILVCPQCSVHALKPDFQWIPLGTIGNLPIPTAFAKLLKAAGLA
jgi:A/G-specific adenine glycosylase